MEMSVRDGERDEAKGAGWEDGGGRDVKPGSRLHLICDYFMALYKDKQHGTLYDLRNFASRAKRFFSYIENSLNPRSNTC